MKKFIILIPIFNDRESLTRLIENINLEVKDLNSEVSIIVVNDASSQQIIDSYPNIENINSLLKLLVEKNHDAVLLDLAMPEFSGLDVMRELETRGDLSDYNIILFTASSIVDLEINFSRSIFIKFIS